MYQIIRALRGQKSSENELRGIENAEAETS